MRALEELLAVAVRWTCRGCSEPQVALASFSPPPDRICHDCQAIADPLPLKLRQARVPPEFLARHLTTDAWEGHFHRPWPVDLSDWCGSPSMLYLWGPTGTGKSSAAAILLARLLAEGAQGSAGVWIDGYDLRRQAKREIKGDVVDALEAYAKPRFAVFDEPLAGRPTAWSLDQAYEVVRARKAANLPTIVTSQIDPSHLIVKPSAKPGEARGEDAAPFPPALVSRLLSGEVVYFDGDDARLRGEGEG